MKLRVSLGLGLKPQYLDLVRCECCSDYLIKSTANLDAHGHCGMCQEPREVKCTRCDVLWREDLIERGLCEQCVSDDEHDQEAAE